jgi:hypothetical protein
MTLLTPAPACRHCGRLCANAAGLSSHERRCPSRRPAATTVTCGHCGQDAPPSKRLPTWCKACAIAEQLRTAAAARHTAPLPRPARAPVSMDSLSMAIIRTIVQTTDEGRKRALRLALLRARYTHGQRS